MLRDLVEDDSPLVSKGIAWHWRDEDQNVASLSLIGLDLDAQMLVMTWYKRRGNTEQVWLIPDDSPPRRPSEEEAQRIIAAFSRDMKAT